MAFFLILIIAFAAFTYYRYRKYQKQREIEEMSADAQAYVSAEVVELLQRFKTIIANADSSTSVQQSKIQKKIKNLTENMLCHTDSEASVREFISISKQDIALINLELDKLAENHTNQANQSFDELK